MLLLSPLLIACGFWDSCPRRRRRRPSIITAGTLIKYAPVATEMLDSTDDGRRRAAVHGSGLPELSTLQMVQTTDFWLCLFGVCLAVGESSVILLHPPLPLAVVSIGMKKAVSSK